MEQNHNVLFEFSNTSRQVQKKNLIDEIKLVFIEKHEFENRAESILKTFWFSDYQLSNMKNVNDKFEIYSSFKRQFFERKTA